MRERTEELTRLNVALARAKGEADAANISKTKFLAAASHDILQPLNAARLYVTSLIERGGRDDRRLVDNIDASLEAVEEIFGALLDMSRLDTGAMRPEFASFRIDELMRQIELEFAPLAAAKGLDLTFVPCSLGGAIRPPPAAPAGAEPRIERHQIHARRTRAGRLPAPRRRSAHRRLRHRRRHSAIEVARYLHRISPPRSGRQDRPRARPRPVDRRTRGARARLHDRTRIGQRPRFAFRGHRSALERGADRIAGARRARASIRANSPASPRSASTTSRRCSTAWKRCCAAGAAR